jgi:hypothetical protein
LLQLMLYLEVITNTNCHWQLCLMLLLLLEPPRSYMTGRQNLCRQWFVSADAGRSCWRESNAHCYELWQAGNDHPLNLVIATVGWINFNDFQSNPIVTCSFPPRPTDTFMLSRCSSPTELVPLALFYPIPFLYTSPWIRILCLPYVVALLHFCRAPHMWG